VPAIAMPVMITRTSTADTDITVHIFRRDTILSHSSCGIATRRPP
jgi:hypothetical protein